MLRLTLAVLHLLALGVGLCAVVERGAALREQPASAASLRRAFRNDTVWGVAAVLWISTGLWRLLAGTEKAPQYYYSNVLFQAKMALLVLILVLEALPMATLIRWRLALARGEEAERVAAPAAARRVATFSQAEALLVVLMVCAAVGMARGYGARG